MPAAAVAALPLVSEVARHALAVAQTPVLGWERSETFTRGRKSPRIVQTRTSFTLRAWELAALGVAGAAAYWVMSQPDQDRWWPTTSIVGVEAPAGPWLWNPFFWIAKAVTGR